MKTEVYKASNFNNTLPVSISIKQLSKGCRHIMGNFCEDDDKCLKFISLATALGFNSNEAVGQINTEREYIRKLIKEKNATI